MSGNPDEMHVYHLSSEHSDWADMDDYMPRQIAVPTDLQPLFLTGKIVPDVNQLHVWAGSSGPEFDHGDASMEATPPEAAEWLDAYAEVALAQRTFREKVEDAQRGYEAAQRKALAGLAQAMEKWRPVEGEMKRRSAALAAKLHALRTAAEQRKQEQEEQAQKEQAQKEQAQKEQDATDGPRGIALYKPKRLDSRNRADHVARVHLMDCRRRAKTSGAWTSYDPMSNDLGLRPGDAWYRLTHPEEWIRSASVHSRGNLRVKFCSSCKPWVVFQEWIYAFPQPRRDAHGFMLAGVQLVDAPQEWATHQGD
ncbi:hypothetical protein [Streptomyces cucumeris]|uniref:hypothetical protein n=1 Tax=Streptomyces cucumeris TaxID=2962890 RepID=UPI0020C9178B|nr:hypothetical protein [Streptomyces sp. NEAU-Y11]MCP9209592.1 hypothetical protein [Streptomyces sp. NEAU-Y11]